MGLPLYTAIGLLIYNILYWSNKVSAQPGELHCFFRSAFSLRGIRDVHAKSQPRHPLPFCYITGILLWAPRRKNPAGTATNEGPDKRKGAGSELSSSKAVDGGASSK